MALKLDKVSRGPHLPTLVASSISREIAQGRLKPGDQLPTEQALATTFGVSRNVIREAIAHLRSEGRVWSQQGRGAFVAEQSNPTVLTIDQDTLQQADAFANLFELRSILEVEAAGLAAQRRSAGDIEAMRAALATMTGVPYGSVEWLRADLAFHLAIAGATGNGYITQMLGFVSDRIRDSILAAGSHSGSDAMAQATLGEHDSVLAAVTAGDADAARRSMARHLQGAAERVGQPPAAAARARQPELTQ